MNFVVKMPPTPLLKPDIPRSTKKEHKSSQPLKRLSPRRLSPSNVKEPGPNPKQDKDKQSKAPRRRSSWSGPNMIIVDSNHAEDFLFTGLGGGTAACPHVVRQRLDLGDVALLSAGHQLVLERKEMGDLSRSITDGRYREQKARMLSSAGGGYDDGTGETPCPVDIRYAFVVEAPRVLHWSKTDKVGGLPTSTLHAAMLKTRYGIDPLAIRYFYSCS